MSVPSQMLTITPYGAAGEVTGSAYLLETADARVLIDFGLFQGDKDDDARNVVPGRIHRTLPDAVLLTHAHLDHCGRLPLLAREGYKGPIFSTPASKAMAELVLKDSAHIQEQDFERRQKRALRHGRKVSRTDTPLYQSEDVDAILTLFKLVEYRQPIQVATGITATFREAGHMLGSASIELHVTSDGVVRTVVFSGDVGPQHLPFLKDPDPPSRADIVIMESTYGDRDHRNEEETLVEFAQILNDAVRMNRRILVPSFAIGRTQQILYYYSLLQRAGRVPDLPIYIDSPMAIKATRIYNEFETLYDQESSELEHSGLSPLRLKNVSFLETAAESMTLNGKSGPFMVIAGSGMCNGGRILHHLRSSIDDLDVDILIVGYQAHGSLGRKLVDGVPEVYIMGERRQVRARIHTLGGLSAHAGQRDLMAWLGTMMSDKPRIILTHGEDKARTALASLIFTRYNASPSLPSYGEHFTF